VNDHNLAGGALAILWSVTTTSLASWLSEHPTLAIAGMMTVATFAISRSLARVNGRLRLMQADMARIAIELERLKYKWESPDRWAIETHGDEVRDASPGHDREKKDMIEARRDRETDALDLFASEISGT
jgi:hypothetical protein